MATGTGDPSLFHHTSWGDLSLSLSVVTYQVGLLALRVMETVS